MKRMTSLVPWSWTSVLILGVLTFLHSQVQCLYIESNTHYDSISSNKLGVFIKGNYQVSKPIKVKKSEFLAPQPLLIISPKDSGLFPVLFFVHGTMTSNEDYTNVFNHIASHGFIVVAPLLFSAVYLPTQEDEIEMAASVINWLPSNLQNVLKTRISKNIEPNLDNLAISGHSRGGKSAFALALGMSNTKLSVNISALIGVDPVAGSSKDQRFEPYVLTYEPNSFKLSVPITIIGTGLGNNTNFWVLPPCAPNNVNHQEFYNECKKSSHFVIMEYGHMQMLNDFVFDLIGGAMSLVCANGNGSKSIMRRTLGGIIVAFLDAYFEGNGKEYFALMENPSLAPTKVYVEKKGYFGFAPSKGQA